MKHFHFSLIIVSFLALKLQEIDGSAIGSYQRSVEKRQIDEEYDYYEEDPEMDLEMEPEVYRDMEQEMGQETEDDSKGWIGSLILRVKQTVPDRESIETFVRQTAFYRWMTKGDCSTSGNDCPNITMDAKQKSADRELVNEAGNELLMFAVILSNVLVATFMVVFCCVSCFRNAFELTSGYFNPPDSRRRSRKSINTEKRKKSKKRSRRRRRKKREWIRKSKERKRSESS